jgi:hypothetical protein
MKFQKLNIMEKIAMIWTTPMAFVVAVVLIAVSVIVYLLRVVFVYSGTAGAAIWYVSAIREKWIANKWDQLRKYDAQSAMLDKNVKP